MSPGGLLSAGTGCCALTLGEGGRLVAPVEKVERGCGCADGELPDPPHATQTPARATPTTTDR